MKFSERGITSTDYLTSLYESKNFLFIRTNYFGNIISTNKAALSFLNLTQGEVLGSSLTSIFSIESSTYSLTYHISNKKKYSGIVSATSHKGKKMFFSITLDLIKNYNNTMEFLLYGSDITQLYRENTSLKEEANFFDEQNKNSTILSLVAKKTSAAVVITNELGLIEWVNNSFTNITGYDLEEVRGKKPGSFLQGKNTDPATVERISKSLKEGKFINESIVNYTKSGEEFIFRLVINPVRNSIGDITHFIAIDTEIKPDTNVVNDSIPESLQNELLSSDTERFLFKKTFENHSSIHFLQQCFRDHFVKINSASKDGGDIFHTDMIGNCLVMVLISSEGTETERTLLNSFILKEYQKYINSYTTEPHSFLKKIDLTLKTIQAKYKVKTTTRIAASYYNLKTKEFGLSSAGIPVMNVNENNEIKYLNDTQSNISTDKSNKFFSEHFQDMDHQKFYFYTTPENLNEAQKNKKGFQKKSFSQFLINLVQLPFEDQEAETKKVSEGLDTTFSVVGLHF